MAERALALFCRAEASVGLALRLTTLLLFGDPVAGTPLMQAVQTAGIDLPRKVLVWEDAERTVFVTDNAPSWIAARRALGPGTSQAVAALTAALEAFAREAAG